MNRPVPTETECAMWRAVLTALAGALPQQYLGHEGHEARELMKLHADAIRTAAATPTHACFRAPAWVLHAFSHWCRAYGLIQSFGADHFDEVFPNGLSFRSYLGAWLWSIGIPQLSMTPADLEAVHSMTGVAPMPHPMLPLGRSEISAKYWPITQVELVPAKDLTAEALDAALVSGSEPSEVQP